ncbi:hypothetical protein ACHWQZ_G007058 [Mnemiopsis leidyi]
MVLGGGDTHNLGDQLSEGATFDVTCNSGFQLGSSTLVDIPCVTGKIPKSCRGIKIKDITTEYVVGSEISLTCLVESEDKVTGVRWIKDGENFRLPGEFGLVSADQPSSYQSVLTFSVASTADAGSYKCEATVDSAAPFDKEMYQSDLQITILDVTMSPEEDPVYVKIHDPFPLHCSFINYASYSLSVSWIQGSSPMSGNIFTNNEGAETTSKITFNAGEAVGYSQEYTCKGEYRHLDSTSLVLTVSDSRRVEVRGISRQPISVSVGIGATAVFDCDAVGEVKGTVEWVVGGVSQDDSFFTTTHSASSRLTRSQLTLESLEKQDSKVQCRVTFNGFTVESNEVELVVYGVGVATHPADSGFLRDTDNTLTCSIQTEPGIVPSVSWYRDTYTHIDATRYSTTANGDASLYTSKLFFENAQFADNGDYNCQANFQIKGRNTLVKSESASVYVRYAMKLPAKEFVTSDLNTDSISFNCYFQSQSEPAAASVQSVTWYVNGINVKGVTNFAIDDSQFNKDKDWRTTLRMTEISPNLAGEVKCSYECGIGPPVTMETMLYVHRQVRLPAETHTASSTFTITCSVGTNLEASVTWFENDAVIGLNDKNFKRLEGTTEDYVQINRLAVQDWGITDDIVTIKCRQEFTKTATTFESSTQFSFKGFTQSPDRYTYYSPEEKRIYCSYGYAHSTAGPVLAKWTKDGQTIDSDPRYEVNVSDRQTGSWEISLAIKGSNGEVTTQDGGVFVCSFKYSDTEEYHRTADVFFYDIETLPADTKFYDAGALTLTCIMKSAGLTVSGVTWARNGVAVSEPAYTSTTESGHLTARLSINEVVADNEGMFSCLFDVPGDKQLQEAIYVQIRNIDMLSEEYVVVDPGSSVELSCSVKNYTQVSLLWYKDGNNVPVGDPTFTYSELVLTSTLTIQSVQNGDLGEYRCGIDASRSRKSSSVSSVSVNAVEDIVLRGSGAATLRCDLTGSSSQPSSVIWTDDDGKEYTSSDTSSDYKVTNGPYSNGDQTTTLEITPSSSSYFTCKFVLPGSVGSRKVLATILDLTATSTLVHKGSDTSVQCRLQGSQATPIVSWTGDNSNFEITTTNGDKDVVSEITVEGVSEDVTYTCTFSVQGKKFTEQTQIQVYSVSIPATHLVETGAELQIQVQTEPELPNIANYVKESQVSQNMTIDGTAAINVHTQRVTVTYASVLTAMSVTYQYSDSSGSVHTLNTDVYVVEFKKSKVAVSDGIEEAELVCVLSGVLSEDMKKDVSSFWMIGGTEQTMAPIISGSSLTSKYDMAVTAKTVDEEVGCGFRVQGTTFSHTATLDIISIVCSEDTELKKGQKATLTCTISGSKHIEPIKSVWYKGSSQELIQSLAGAGWPDPITTALPDVSSKGSYRCSIDMGVAEFTRTIEITEEGGGVVPVSPTDPPDSDPKSSKNLPLIIGVTVPVILVIIAVVVVGYCCFKKHRTRRASFHVKTLSMNSNSFNRPESLIYANDGQASGAHRAARYTQHHDDDQGQVHSNNLRVNYRVNNQYRPEHRPQTKRAAPTPPSSGSLSSARTDHVRSADPSGVRFNRDFDAGVYSRNLAANKHLGPTNTSNA